MFEAFLFSFFALNTLYVLTLSVAGHLYKRKPVSDSSPYQKIVILVPCYKEDRVILHTTKLLLQLDYPSKYYDVVVIADSLKQETIELLTQTRAIVIPVSFEKSTKSKSLNFALNAIGQQYEIAMVADADNVFSPEILREASQLYDSGYPIVQFQRVAKNLNTSMALLDGLSEAINNHLYRQGSNALGLSSALIGSGMSFPFSVFKETLAKIDSPVEDKALQIALAENGYKIHYRKGTMVYDEKVETPEAYKNQRRRWIGGQYKMLFTHFFKGFAQLIKGNINYFNLAICQNLFPSRINSLLVLFILAPIMTWWFYPSLEIALRWWWITGLYILALLLAIPRTFYTKELVKAIFILPQVIAKTIQAILQSKSATRTFIHTEHGTTSIDTLYHKK